MIRLLPFVWRRRCAKLDAWAAQQPDLPGRPEAIRRLVELGLKAKQMSNANDDKSPLIDLRTCIVCNVTMKIANTAPDAQKAAT